MKGPFRAGPWPGLTPAGAAVLLGCAVLLALGEAIIGTPQRPLPDLPLTAVVSVVPLAIATRIIHAPGVASAVCGAYLLPRTLFSLVLTDVALPPLLLIPALAFDVALWLRIDDLKWRRRRRRRSIDRSIGTWRAAMAGLVYGVLLTVVEPPYRVLLGANEWATNELVLSAIFGAIVSAAIAAAVIVRGRAW